jgi:Flp pilus assembly protein TadG
MKSERGHAMLELAACAGVMLAFLAGTVEFGYTFYLYNQLVTAVGNGARYAASRTYRSASQPDVEKGASAIRNMVVFGNPHPEAGAEPIVPGLTAEEIEVKWTLDQTGVPEFVHVTLLRHQVNAVFGTFPLAGRPSVQFPYVGHFAPGEREP